MLSFQVNNRTNKKPKDLFDFIKENISSELLTAICIAHEYFLLYLYANAQ